MRAINETVSLKDVEKKFARWRRTRRPRERIPETLWSAAAKLTKKISIHKVSRRLHLNHTALKQRADGRTTSSAHADGCAPSFVEVPWLSKGKEPDAACVVEIRRGEGAVMTLSIHKEGAVDMAVVIRSFLGGGA